MPNVTAARRAFLAEAYRQVASAVDTSVQAAHPLAPQIVEPSMLVHAADAATEVARRQTLRAARRRWFQVVVPMTDTYLDVDLGDVIALTHPRFGLSGGALVRVLGIQPDAQGNRITWTLWGG